MVKTYLGLGSNLGNRLKNLEQACIAIGIEAGTIVDKSPVYETEPWGFESKEKFLNMVVSVETLLSAHDLLEVLQEIENKIGRVREGIGYLSRTIDIDILLYSDLLISTRDLIVPHPLFHKRMFVLKPFSDIASNLVHPALNKSIADLYEGCIDKSIVKQVKE